MTSPMLPGHRDLARFTAVLSQLAFWSGLVVITYLALMPLEHTPAVSVSGKARHLVAFTYLTITMWCAYRFRVPPQRLALILFGYGLGIELVQLVMPYRCFELLDLAADASGIALGAACLIAATRVTPGASLYPTR